MGSDSSGRADRAAASRAALLLWQKEGKWVNIALKGVSMDPLIRDGATLRVRFGHHTTDRSGAPRDLRVGDIVVYSAAAGLIAHRIIRVGRRGRRAGWVRVKGDPLFSRRASWLRAEEVLGRVASVTQPDGTRLYLNTPAGRLLNRAAAWTSMTLGAIDTLLPGRGNGRPADSLAGRALSLLGAVHRSAQQRLEKDAGRLLTQEDRFLIEVCRPRLRADDVSRIKTCDTAVLDWELLRDQATRLGLAPLLHRNITDPRLEAICPEAFVAQLARASHLSAYLSMHRRQELARLLDLLAQKGVEPVLLKGGALGAVVYEDPLLRTMNDLDLLVRDDEIPIAVSALESLSYRPLYRARHSDPALRDAFYASHHHVTPLIAPKGRAVVELHRHIMTMGGEPRYDIETIRARAQRTTIEGRSVLVPSPADLLLHTCLHLSYADRFVGKLRDLIDLHETVSLFGEKIDWGVMLAEVPSGAAARCLYSCLDLSRRLYGTPVPADFLYEMRRASGLGFFGAGLLRALACSVLFNGPGTSRSILPPASAKWCCDTLLRRPGWSSRLRDFASLLAE